MRSQEQAFRAYYASMTDTELLQIAANEKSFIPVAQKILEDELAKRRLMPLGPPISQSRHTLLGDWAGHLAKWTRRQHRHPASP